jgi:hypothetical protein
VITETWRVVTRDVMRIMPILALSYVLPSTSSVVTSTSHHHLPPTKHLHWPGDTAEPGAPNTIPPGLLPFLAIIRGAVSHNTRG